MYYQPENSNHRNYHDINWFYNIDFLTHWHEDFELILVLAGMVEVTIDNRLELLRRGDWALVLNNQIHSYKTSTFSSAIVHVFSGDVCGTFYRQVSNQIGDSFLFHVPHEIRNFYLDTLVTRKDYSDFALKGCLYLILEYYLNSVKLSERKPMQTSLIYSIFSYISTHFTEKITFDDIAAVCGYDAHYLSRVFSASVGINFRRVVNSYRLNYAMSLMEQGNMSMTDIAFASGFGSIRSFNRAFAEQYQSTPKKIIPELAGRQMNGLRIYKTPDTEDTPAVDTGSEKKR